MAKSPVLSAVAAVTAFLLVVSVIYARANSDNDSNQREPLTVLVAPVERLQQFELQRWFSGRIQPSQRINLASELAGKIASIHFDEGDRVSAGAKVIELDKSLLSSEKTSLESQVSGVEAELDLAQLRLSRQSNLRGKGFSSVETIDEIETNITQLKSRRQTLLTQIDTLNIRLEKSDILSPFHAVVQRRMVDLGAVVNAGTPLLELVEQAEPEIKIGLPVQLVDQMTLGESYEFIVDDVAENKSVFAKLISLAPAVDLTTQTIAARFQLSPTESGLKLGGFARVKIPVVRKLAGFWIPNTALIEGERGLWNIFSVSKNKLVQKHSVEILVTDNERSFVTANLENRALVIQNGLNRVAPNMLVTYQEI